MLCSLNDLKIYKEYCDNVSNGVIIPYDENVVERLKNHKNKEDKTMKSYLNTMLSHGNNCSTYLKSRYLLQFLPSDYYLCDGYLESFDNKFYHSWIENEDKVYDTLFIGVWPKELYYQLMKPNVVKTVYPDKDEECLRMQSRTIETTYDEVDFGYNDWYSYMKNNTINTRCFIEPLRLKKFKNERC